MSSLEDAPQWLADYWSINLEAAQAILCLFVILAVMLPTFIFARGEKAATIEVILLLIIECLLVGIGWAPFWLLIATVAAMAMAIALLSSSAIVGK